MFAVRNRTLPARRAAFLIDKEGKITVMQANNEAVDPTKIIDTCTIPTAPK